MKNGLEYYLKLTSEESLLYKGNKTGRKSKIGAAHIIALE